MVLDALLLTSPLSVAPCALMALAVGLPAVGALPAHAAVVKVVSAPLAPTLLPPTARK